MACVQAKGAGFAAHASRSAPLSGSSSCVVPRRSDVTMRSSSPFEEHLASRVVSCPARVISARCHAANPSASRNSSILVRSWILHLPRKLASCPPAARPKSPTPRTAFRDHPSTFPWEVIAASDWNASRQRGRNSKSQWKARLVNILAKLDMGVHIASGGWAHQAQSSRVRRLAHFFSSLPVSCTKEEDPTKMTNTSEGEAKPVDASHSQKRIPM